MNGKESAAELLIMCVVMTVLSILGVVGGLTRDLFGTLDGLLVLFIALLMFLISCLLLFFLAKEQGWIGKHPDSGSTQTPAAGK